MIRIIGLFLMVLGSVVQVGFAEPIRYSQLEKQANVLTVELKTYELSDSERISLYGGKLRKFLTPNWYWGPVGYGAVTGKRSGYLEGGVMAGWMTQYPSGWVVDARFFTGAGGGGSALQGGGFLVHPTFGVGRKFWGDSFLVAEIGYMQFISGEVSSLSFGFNINVPFWSLSVDREAKAQGAIAPYKTRRRHEHVLVETYTTTDKGAASLIGFHFDDVKDDGWLTTLAIFGAIAGERGGYGKAMVGLGRQFELHPRFMIAPRFLVGSGGGGGLDAGDGLLVEGLVGFHTQLLGGVFLDIFAGYQSYVLGTFDTPIITVGFSHEWEFIYGEYPKNS